jgi:tetratricopeptide (TPR) repeat protein
MRNLVKKRSTVVLLLALLMVGVMATTVLAAPKVFVNGLQLKFEVEPIIDNGRVMVPLRAIFESLEAQVDWIPETQTINAVSKHGAKLTLQIGNTRGTLEKDGVQSTIIMEVPPKIIDGRTLVPLRVIGESFNKEVTWQQAGLSAYIDDPKNYEHYIGEANYYFNCKDWGRAVNWFTRAIEDSPNDHQSMYKRAYCNLQIPDLNAAMFDLNKAITLSPKTAEYYSLRSAVNEKMGKSEEAAADQQRAGELKK